MKGNIEVDLDYLTIFELMNYPGNLHIDGDKKKIIIE